MAYILHIDTSGDKGTVALSQDGQVLNMEINTDTRNHAAIVNLYIDRLLKVQGLGMKDLSAISVCGGPGSYTGLRIGLSTAKALCYALNIPLLHHSRLLLLVLEEFYNNSSKYEQFATILPAREQEYFFCIYDKKIHATLGPKHIFNDELRIMVDEIVLSTFITGKISSESDFTNNENIFFHPNVDIDINSWAKFAYERYLAEDFADIAMTEPFYLKQVYTHK